MLSVRESGEEDGGRDKAREESEAGEWDNGRWGGGETDTIERMTSPRLERRGKKNQENCPLTGSKEGKYVPSSLSLPPSLSPLLPFYYILFSPFPHFV